MLRKIFFGHILRLLGILILEWQWETSKKGIIWVPPRGTETGCSSVPLCFQGRFVYHWDFQPLFTVLQLLLQSSLEKTLKFFSGGYHLIALYLSEHEASSPLICGHHLCTCDKFCSPNPFTSHKSSAQQSSKVPLSCFNKILFSLHTF